MRGELKNEFIDLTIQIYNLVPSRRPARTTQITPLSLASSTEPMQIGYTHLSPEERERRIHLHLCLNCGESGHLKSSCSVGPSAPNSRMVSAYIQHRYSTSCVRILVKLFIGSKIVAVEALLDSGKAGNFMSNEFAHKTSPSSNPM